MQNIDIRREDLQTVGIKRISNYSAQVIDYGHQPGVLSGANLKGTARQHAAKYAARRASVAAAVEAATGVRSEIVKADGRNVRVWTLDGEPVELTLVD